MLDFMMIAFIITLNVHGKGNIFLFLFF